MPKQSMDQAWDMRGRGLKDSLRHDQRVKEAIKKNLRELIGEEAIITSDGTKRIKIPLRYLDQYRFKYGQPQQGIGQGQGQPGDVLGNTGQGNTSGDGQPGDQPGEHTYEAEVPLEDLVEMMLKDLALPWLEEKPMRHVIAEHLRFKDIRRKGAISRLAKKRTLLENLKRNAARGDAHVRDLHDDDLRFYTWDIEQELHSNAAVYMLMDVSGSMTTSKKYIAKSFFFWMVRFLQAKYKNVDTVFIAHDTEAHIVEEKDFFGLSQGGGTRCSSAYKLALDNIRTHHPKSAWNTYVFHFSDGDNLPNDNNICKNLAQELLEECQMLGYGEIKYRDDASFYGWVGQGASAMSSLQSYLNQIGNKRLIVVTITHKEELMQVLQKFLQPQTAVP